MSSMSEDERIEATAMRDRLSNILPDLKMAYDNAKSLESRHEWDLHAWDLCEAYMTVADVYIGLTDTLKDLDEGDDK